MQVNREDEVLATTGRISVEERQSLQKTRLGEIVLGFPKNSNFIEMVTAKNPIFVDKTFFIAELLCRESNSCLLITRPRGCGKSLMLNMIFCFFAKQVNKDGQPMENTYRCLFAGGEFKFKDQIIKLPMLKIGKYEDIMQHQGKYPMIMMNWKTLTQSSSFLSGLRSQIARMCQTQFPYLEKYLQQDKRPEDVEYFQKLRSQTTSDQHLLYSLDFLLRQLARFHETPVILLIDEYDAPVTQLIFKGQSAKEVMKQIRLFLCPIKSIDNDQFLKIAILTGVFEIFSMEIGSSPFNHLVKLSVINSRYSQYFGFLTAEIKQMIKKISQVKLWSSNHQKIEKNFFENQKKQEDIDQIMDQIKYWSNGYTFNYVKEKIYNPYEIILYLKNLSQGDILTAKSQWAETGNFQFLKKNIKTIDLSFMYRLQILLLAPKHIHGFRLQTRMSFSQFDLSKPISEEIFINILLYGGYLTGTVLGISNQLQATIPNTEKAIQLYRIFMPQIQARSLEEQKITLAEVKIYQTLNLQNSKEVQESVINQIKRRKRLKQIGSYNETLFSIYIAFMLGFNDRHTLSLELTVGQLGHILLPNALILNRSDTTIIHEYKYDENGQDGRKKSIEGLWQIYEQNYMNHVLSSSNFKGKSIILRSIVLSNKSVSNERESPLTFSRDQIHSLDTAKKICAFFMKHKRQQKRIQSMERKKQILKREKEHVKIDQMKNRFVLYYEKIVEKNFDYGSEIILKVFPEINDYRDEKEEERKYSALLQSGRIKREKKQKEREERGEREESKEKGERGEKRIKNVERHSKSTFEQYRFFSYELFIEQFQQLSSTTVTTRKKKRLIQSFMHAYPDMDSLFRCKNVKEISSKVQGCGLELAEEIYAAVKNLNRESYCFIG